MSFLQDLGAAITGGPVKVHQSAAEGKLHEVTNNDLNALQGLVAEQIDDTKGNRSRIKAGRDGADFWRGTRENLPGLMNPANRANLGATLGGAHSVMTHNAYAGGEEVNLAKVVNLSRGFAAAESGLSESKRADATAGAQREMHNAEIKQMNRQSALDGALSFIGGAVQGYTTYGSFAVANPAKAAKIDGKVGDFRSDLSEWWGRIKPGQGVAVPPTPNYKSYPSYPNY